MPLTMRCNVGIIKVSFALNTGVDIMTEFEMCAIEKAICVMV